MTTQTQIDKELLGNVHNLTLQMWQLSKTIERLHPESINRQKAIADYQAARESARCHFKKIINKEDRSLARFYIRTASKPVDNKGNPIA